MINIYYYLLFISWNVIEIYKNDQSEPTPTVRMHRNLFLCKCKKKNEINLLHSHDNKEISVHPNSWYCLW